MAPSTQARFAEASGAVGLVVVNHEVGGGIWVMPWGDSQKEGNTRSDIAIPVVMVRKEQNSACRRQLFLVTFDVLIKSALCWVGM